MNNYSFNIKIKAPVNTLQDIINSRCLAEESIIKYCSDNEPSCWLHDCWPPIIDQEESIISLSLYSRGFFPLEFFNQIQEHYPNSSTSIKVYSMGAQWYHYILSEEGAYEVYDVEDFRNEVIDTRNLMTDGFFLDYEIAYQFMLPETRSWRKRFGADNSTKEFGDIIPFPEDLVPGKFKAAWNEDRESFKKLICALVESWHSLEKLSEPESTSQFVDDDECPF